MQNDTSMVKAITLFLVALLLYFMPALNARSRQHPSLATIFFLNLLLGWTLIGWLVAIMWSASDFATSGKALSNNVEQAVPDKYQQLEKLGSLKERGFITDEEFQAEKQKLLNS
jgi:Superinfection immunity protein/Short C-terminal domain